MLDKIQEKAAERSAETLTLILEKAESRLAEIIEQRRHNRGEMLTQMTGKVYDKGITFETVTWPQGGTKIVPVYSQEFTDSLEQSKPIDDADLVKAIDITFKRLGAYRGKTDAAPAPVQNKPPAVVAGSAATGNSQDVTLLYIRPRKLFWHYERGSRAPAKLTSRPAAVGRFTSTYQSIGTGST